MVRCTGCLMILKLVQRIVATPLAAKKGNRGSDTGFWKDLEGRMRALVTENGDDRKGPKWVE